MNPLRTSVGVEHVTDEHIQMLTPIERRAARTITHVVVARTPDGRSAVVAAGRAVERLERVAAELARAYAAEHVPHADSCVSCWRALHCVQCGGMAVQIVTEVFGRPVPWWRHCAPDGRPHPARVAVAR